jgi:mannosyl-oligosaccharide glucosidase
MEGYGWEEYDIRTGGRQVIHDKGNQIDITTEFVKMPGGEHGGSWAARISGKPREDASETIKTTMIFYAAMGGMSVGNPEDAGLQIENQQDPLGYEGDLNIGGYTKELGAFRLQLTPGPSTNTYPDVEHPHSEGKPLDRTLAQSGTIPEEHVWQARAIVFQTIQQAVKGVVEQYGENDMPPPCLAMTIPNGNVGVGNFHLTQKVFEGAFEFDIIYSSASGGKQYTSQDITERLSEVSESFKDKYAKVFAAQAPFDGKKYDQFSKTMFSNLLGGVGYFHGDSVVDRSYAEEYDEDNEGFWEEAAEARARNQQAKEGPSELFSAVPSRPFFPRGFLWDEGFHLLPIADWDTDVT